ncbi:MAG TPA: hypothetical protein VN706_23385 [Gemmatimonadaceae bacterium]|nr:hypothetical protein [Gemmatimonadaceae bacterium]
MLVIRREQLKVFENERWEQFLRKVIARARVDMPEVLEGKTDDELLALLRSATPKVRSMGFLVTAHITRFCLLVLRLGADPVDDPLLAPVIRDRELSAAVKIDTLERMASR